MPLLNASYAAVERRWLSEWLANNEPFGMVTLEKRLTVADVAAQRRMGAGVKPRAASRIVAKLDAWVDFPDHIEMWEAKRRSPVQAVVQLRGYQLELPHTWEGQNEAVKPITYHVLVEHYQDRAQRLADEYGILYHVYLPDWLNQIELATMAAGQARRLAYLQSIGQAPVA